MTDTRKHDRCNALIEGCRGLAPVRTAVAHPCDETSPGAEVVYKDTGIRTARRIGHVFIMDVPTSPRTLFVTDAVNIFPTLEDKVDIVQNAIDLAHALKIATHKVAVLSAVETITSKMPSTIETAALRKMAERGRITGALPAGEKLTIARHTRDLLERRP